MKTRWSIAGVLLAASSTAACSDGDTSPGRATVSDASPGAGDATDGGGQGGDASCHSSIVTQQIVLTDRNNYSFANDMTVGVSLLRGATDLLFDWSGVTKDLFGHALNPATDIAMVYLTLWRMTPAELEASLEEDRLPTSRNKGIVNSYPEEGVTSEHLMDFGFNGSALSEADQAILWSKFDTSAADYAYPPDEYTFMVTASSSRTPGKDSRALGFFMLDPNATATEFRLTSRSTTVAIEVDLRRAAPIAVPMHQPNLTIDWSQMTVNALGNEFVPVQINEAIIGHFPDLTLSQLEARFLELELLPGRRWKATVESGVTVNLGSLIDDDGEAFSGIDTAAGVWLVALRCTQHCNSPAPWAIAILQSC